MSRHHVRIGLALAAGFAGGALLYHFVFDKAVATVTGSNTRVAQTDQIAAQHTKDQLSSAEETERRSLVGLNAKQADLPYDVHADAHAQVAAARTAAVKAGKFLMVTFGANWCVDCRTLHRSIHSEDVARYAQDRFLFVNVNVGEFNRNQDLAAELGVTLARGIPVAIFYDQTGDVIGTTNHGELEPARLYNAKQILKFLRDVAERSTILAPDAVW